MARENLSDGRQGGVIHHFFEVEKRCVSPRNIRGKMKSSAGARSQAREDVGVSTLALFPVDPSCGKGKGNKALSRNGIWVKM